jgi:phospholipase A1
MFAFSVNAVASDSDAVQCATIDNDRERLLCYDRAFGRLKASPLPGLPQTATAIRDNTSQTAVPPEPAAIAGIQQRAQSDTSRTIDEAWGLKQFRSAKTFELKAHKPMYFLFATRSDAPNLRPTSANPATTATSPLSLDSTEAQFQISFKTKVWEAPLGPNSALWTGYTQSSRWQVYNDSLSRPFRETNYEPEAMLVFETTPYRVLGLDLRTASVGINHQSNGRSLPLSRSWNRVIGQVGLERDDWMVLVRPWWRIPEQSAKDDNPAIQDYLGRGEFVLAKRFGGQVWSVVARHSFRGGDRSRGSVRLDWSLPISGYLKAHLQIFSGYGESLVDYNHRQTTVGVGASLVEWR